MVLFGCINHLYKLSLIIVDKIFFVFIGIIGGV